MIIQAPWWVILFNMLSPFMAVGLGGYLVWKTKRESTDSLFSLTRPKGSAFVVDPYQKEEEKAEDEKDVPESLMERIIAKSKFPGGGGPPEL